MIKLRKILGTTYGFDNETNIYYTVKHIDKINLSSFVNQTLCDFTTKLKNYKKNCDKVLLNIENDSFTNEVFLVIYKFDKESELEKITRVLLEENTEKNFKQLRYNRYLELKKEFEDDRD